MCYCCRYALYALVVTLVYVFGLPVAVFVILFRRRHELFGDAADPFVATTRDTYGFLYEVRSGGVVVVAVCCNSLLPSLLTGAIVGCLLNNALNMKKLLLCLFCCLLLLKPHAVVGEWWLWLEAVVWRRRLSVC